MAFRITMDDIKNPSRLACLITAFGTVQFFILTTIAALTYPIPYDYFGMYFSQLGLTMVEGIPNSLGNMLFLITLTLVGICVIPFWLVMRTLFTTTSTEKIVALIGTIIGLLAAPLIVGVGLFPGDTEPELHGFTARYFFLAMGFAILIYSIAMLLNKDYSNLFAIVGFLILILVLIYVFVPLGAWAPLTQKIVVYSYIGWILIQLTRIWQLVGSN